MQKEEKPIGLKEFFTVAEVPGYLFLLLPVVFFLSFRKREAAVHSSVDISALIQIMFVILSFLVSFYFLFLSKKDRPVLLFRSPQKFLFAYILLCFVSTAWSSNVFLTAYRSFEALTYLLLITLVIQRLANRLSFQNMIEWAVMWITWVLLWAILSKMKWAGLSYLVWPFKAGRLAVPMFFFIALFLTKKRFNKYLIIIFSILSISNKVFFGIAFGMIGFFFGNVKYRGLFLVLGFSIAIAFAIWGETVLQNTLFYGREGIGMEYTSGRDKIWAASWEYYMHKPLTGHGYVSGENDMLFRKFKGVITTHNVFLSALVGTGILGGILMAFYFVSAFLTAISPVFENGKWKVAFVGTVIMSFVVSMTAPGLGARVYGAWTPVVFVLTLISGMQYKAQQELTENEIKTNVN